MVEDAGDGGSSWLRVLGVDETSPGMTDGSIVVEEIADGGGGGAAGEGLVG